MRAFSEPLPQRSRKRNRCPASRSLFHDEPRPALANLRVRPHNEKLHGRCSVGQTQRIFSRLTPLYVQTGALTKRYGAVTALDQCSLGAERGEIFGLLGKAVELALDGEPNSAALHYGRARVLERLGRPLEAINAIERAVQIDSRFVRALIHLGKLYQQTDQADDARQRLEQAITLGADYADVYFLLGNLYRDGGERERARQAYRSALRINGDYTAAKNALQSLAA